MPGEWQSGWLACPEEVTRINPIREREGEGIELPEGRRLHFLRNQRPNCGVVALVTTVYEDAEVRVRLFKQRLA